MERSRAAPRRTAKTRASPAVRGVGWGGVGWGGVGWGGVGWGGVGWGGAKKYPGDAAMEPLPVDMQHGRIDRICLRRGGLGNHARSPQRARDPESPHRLACLQIARGSRSEANDGAFMQRVCAHDTLPTPRRCSSFIRQSNRDDGAADGASPGNRLLRSDKWARSKSQAHRQTPRASPHVVRS